MRLLADEHGYYQVTRRVPAESLSGSPVRDKVVATRLLRGSGPGWLAERLAELDAGDIPALLAAGREPGQRLYRFATRGNYGLWTEGADRNERRAPGRR